MDRNTIIGFALLALMLIGYMGYNQHAESKFQEQKRADSVAYARAHPHPVVDSSKVVAQAAIPDSIKRNLPPAFNGTAQTVVLENKKLALQFSSKGAYPLSAQIKGYKTYYKDSLFLFKGGDKDNQFYAVLPINNGSVSTADLYYTPVVRNDPNGDRTIDFTSDLGDGKKVDIEYTLPADDYMMRCSIHLTGMPSGTLLLNWQTSGLHTEKDITNERSNTQIYFHRKNDDNDYYTIRSEQGVQKTLSDGPITWIGFRKQYFSSVLIADDGFSKANINGSYKLADTNVTARNVVIAETPLKASGDQVASFRWFIGPNDYRTLKSYNLGMEDMVPMGTGIMAFVKYINRFILIPIFYFLSGFVHNYGIIIIIMTIFIRLILSFFTYKSYLSAAKMRVMKPELDELRKQYGDDQQKFGMEQMKLYRSAGVNPLGGCLPMLFQIPFLFAMYYMFPSFIEFRQQSFLWAKDMSTYDSILNLPFTIPFYGDHVSLFTLLMTATSLFLALYNRNMTNQDPNNPVMKYIPFIYPIIFLGVFNKMAAALTFYYTFSNLLSITQQFVIQKYFINEKAIHAQLQENRNKPAAPSKWTQRLEQIQKQQADRAKVQQKGMKK